MPFAALALAAVALVLPTHDGSTLKHQAMVSRRVLLGSAVTLAPFAAEAATKGRDNIAEEKLAALLTKKVKEREESLGFKLDADDILEIENILRNKYCGPQGAYSGEPGGTCAESPQMEATCFNANRFAPSCSKSFDK